MIGSFSQRRVIRNSVMIPQVPKESLVIQMMRSHTQTLAIFAPGSLKRFIFQHKTVNKRGNSSEQELMVKERVSKKNVTKHFNSSESSTRSFGDDLLNLSSGR